MCERLTFEDVGGAEENHKDLGDGLGPSGSIGMMNGWNPV